LLLWTIGGDFIESINHVAIAATISDQPLRIAAGTSALVTSDIQHVELAG
jgi:hypothetical protein